VTRFFVADEGLRKRTIKVFIPAALLDRFDVLDAVRFMQPRHVVIDLAYVLANPARYLTRTRHTFIEDGECVGPDSVAYCIRHGLLDGFSLPWLWGGHQSSDQT
jgi:hypothetical protein